MFELTTDVIENTIASTSANIVACAAEQFGQPIEQVAECFQTSKTAALLRDVETGYYWDSIPELYAMFVAELQDFQRENGDVVIENASVSAIKQAQKAFAGAAPDFGYQNEADVLADIMQSRY